jgi:hypothetical protein
MNEISDTRVTAKNDNWVPACGGTETPFTSRSGKRLLYCWQPSTGQNTQLTRGTASPEGKAEIAMMLHTPNL